MEWKQVCVQLTTPRPSWVIGKLPHFLSSDAESHKSNNKDHQDAPVIWHLLLLLRCELMWRWCVSTWLNLDLMCPSTQPSASLSIVSFLHNQQVLPITCKLATASQRHPIKQTVRGKFAKSPENFFFFPQMSFTTKNLMFCVSLMLTFISVLMKYLGNGVIFLLVCSAHTSKLSCPN